jgi:hypothetical protein
MSTQGKDFFDKDWFDDHVVILFEAPMETLRWWLKFDEDRLHDWLLENPHGDKSIAKSVVEDFSVKALITPMGGENIVVHHFEKILWLVQSYCQTGWKNSVKAVNHMDDGTYMVHPGTNRCVAAKFLNCKTMPLMLTVHKEQNAFKELRDKGVVITNEETLRKSLLSSDTILFRTEVEERLFVNSVDTGKTTKDFTYEFLGSDAWPEKLMPTNFEGFTQIKLDQWSDLVFRSLPMVVNNPTDCKVHTDMLNFKFFDRTKGLFNKFDLLQCNLPMEELPSKCAYSGISIHIEKEFLGDIFELLLFVDPQKCVTHTKDKSIVIINNEHPANRKGIDWSNKLIIPDSYVSKF